MLHADGGIRHIHAQWRVKAGPSQKPESVLGVLMDDTEAFELARSLGDATEQLALSVDMANIAIWRHDLKTNLMHYSDRAFKVLDMQPRSDGITIAEVRALIHPEDLPGCSPRRNKRCRPASPPTWRLDTCAATARGATS